MYPYSYFKAEGLSLEAVLAVEEAKETLAEIKDILCKKYKASDVYIGDESPRQTLFLFTSREILPKGWAVKSTKLTPDGKNEKFIIALPSYDTADAFNVACLSGLADRALSLCSLKTLLQSPDFPLKKLPAGQYFTSFVRHTDVATGTPYQQYNDMIGRLNDNVTTHSRSNVPITVPDLLDYKKFKDAWYIRVPNDAKGKSLYAPPDSIAVDYAEMRRNDEYEFNSNATRVMGGAFVQRKKRLGRKL